MGIVLRNLSSNWVDIKENKMKTFAVVCVSMALFATASSSGCESPKVSHSSYTPTDAQALTHIPFIAEFSLTCKGVAPTGDVPIYANVNGNIVQVARSKDGSKYQVGWSTEMKHAKTGDYKISLYDEDGYGAVKRVLERGEDVETVKPMATIVVNYPGAYKGAYVSSELIASVLAILVFYFAYSAKSKLLAWFLQVPMSVKDIIKQKWILQLLSSIIKLHTM